MVFKGRHRGLPLQVNSVEPSFLKYIFCKGTACRAPVGEASKIIMQDLGKMLIFGGLILAGVGLFLVLAGKIPFLGKLPGDILIQRKNFTFYFPLATTIIISIILSLFLWIWQKR